jgi:hypothetical protein
MDGDDRRQTRVGILHEVDRLVLVELPVIEHAHLATPRTKLRNIISG